MAARRALCIQVPPLFLGSGFICASQKFMNSVFYKPLVELFQIYSFGALGDKCELIRF